LIFGQLDLGTGQGEVIALHTAMTLPWTTAKLLLHFLRLNIAIHELEAGKIRINPRVFPTEPPPLTPEFENNEVAKAAREISLRMRDEFIAEQGG